MQSHARFTRSQLSFILAFAGAAISTSAGVYAQASQSQPATSQPAKPAAKPTAKPPAKPAAKLVAKPAAKPTLKPPQPVAAPVAPPDPGLIGAPAAPAAEPMPPAPAAPAAPVAEPNPAAPAGGPNGKPDSSAQAPAPPARGFVWLKGEETHVGNQPNQGDMAYPLEVYAFDISARKAGELGGIVLTLKDTPVKLVMYGLAALSSPSASLSARMSNTILDFSSVQGTLSVFTIGVEESTDGAMLAQVNLEAANLKEAFVSPEDIVFPEETRTIAHDGPFVQLNFLTGKAADGSAPAQDLTLVVNRNDKEVTRQKVAAGTDFSIALKRAATENDAVDWRVEDSSGGAIYKGVLGFPVRGAAPGLVTYKIAIGEQPVHAAQ